MLHTILFNQHKRKVFILLFFSLVTSSSGLLSSAYGGAFEQLQGMPGAGSGYIPPVSSPKCVEGCEGSNYNDSGGERHSLVDVISERYEEAQRIAQEKRQAEERAQKEEAFSLNEQGNHAYDKQQWLSAIEFYKSALKKSPNDKVIKSNLDEAELQYNRLRESKSEQSQYQKKMQTYSSLMPIPKPKSLEDRNSPTVKRLPGFSDTQWKEYTDAQETVNELYAKLNREGVLSDAESQKFYSALNRRNELWILAVQQPLDDVQRSKMTLSLPIVVNKRLLKIDAIMNKLDLSAKPEANANKSPDRRVDRNSSDPDAIMSVFASDFFSDKTSAFVEYKVGETIEEIHGEGMKGTYDNFLGIGHIIMAVKEKDSAGAAAKTVDFILSKMSEPLSAHAELAVEGGRLYSNVTYRALNRFMTDAMKATGKDFDAEAFWKRFDDELTTSQKGVKKWVEFGE
jgi:tetratricopeptide (TPR) repeat protein